MEWAEELGWHPVHICSLGGRQKNKSKTNVSRWLPKTPVNFWECKQGVKKSLRSRTGLDICFNVLRSRQVWTCRVAASTSRGTRGEGLQQQCDHEAQRCLCSFPVEVKKYWHALLKANKKAFKRSDIGSKTAHMPGNHMQVIWTHRMWTSGYRLPTGRLFHGAFS